ncbi:hypothetical protein [Curtobacterium pusillum]|uniref:hypothetical protein n=1 Tax=Curtobacterium pusillum TaxID=69373 RepID=UPI0011A5FDD7|nr:hypothetical protein [Curtobacterium pusillum]
MTSDLRPRTRAITRTTVSVLAGVLLLPGLLAACSSAPDTSNASDGPANAGAAALAECMRDKGYDMEDPSSGGLKLSPPDGVDADQWREALVGCTGKGSGAGEAAPAQALPGGEDMARAIGECMRKAGYEDFPDDLKSQASYTPSGDTTAFDRDQVTCAEEASSSTAPVQ